MSDMKQDILAIGVRLWAAGIEPSARRIAAEAGLAGHAAVLYHFTTSSRLRDAVARHAVDTGDSRVIVRLIAEKHPAVCDIPDADRLQHMQACR